jgi:hypothetical protein
VTSPFEGIVAKDRGAQVCTIFAGFTRGAFGARDAIKRRLAADIVCSRRRQGEKPAQDPQHRARYSSVLIF